jgi:Ca-activated chloride channel family protein
MEHSYGSCLMLLACRMLKRSELRIMKRTGYAAVCFVALLCGLLTLGCSSGDERGGVPAPASSDSGASAPPGAEAFYRRLMAEHGQNLEECLREVETSFPGRPASGEPAVERKQLNVVVALDSSGSMAGRIAGEIKMDAAKGAVSRFLAGLPKGARVGLVVYGHRGANDDAGKSASCAGVEEVYALAQADSESLSRAVGSFQATGWTPLAGGIARAGESLKGFTGEDNQNVVYVVSDGLETCGGDPAEAARSLHTSKARAVVNIIGFDVRSDEQRRLREVAEAGGGEFFAAQSGADLNQTFEGTSERLLRVYGQIKSAGIITDYNFASGHFETCVNLKIVREQNAISEVFRRMAPEDTNRQYLGYVQGRMGERRAGVGAFVSRVKGELESKRELTLEELRRYLGEATREPGGGEAR